jgi:uncharacterized protein (TIGR02001 family)
MRNYCKTIGALAAASALVAGNASAEVEYEIHTGYTSEYLFRGLNLGQDLIEAGVDVSTEWNGLGLSAGAWYGSFQGPTGIAGAPINVNNANADELDIYVEVSKDLGFATAAVGYIYYYYPTGSANNNLLPLVGGTVLQDAQEAYFSLSREFFFGFDASLTYYWDIETDNDGYLAGDLSKSIELSPCLTLNGGGTLGYLVEQGELAHLTVKLSLDWAFTETATLSPFVAHSWALGEEGAYLGSENELVGGAMLSVGF